MLWVDAVEVSGSGDERLGLSLPAKSEAVGRATGSVLSILLSSGSRSMGTSLRGRFLRLMTREWYCNKSTTRGQRRHLLQPACCCCI